MTRFWNPVDSVVTVDVGVAFGVSAKLHLESVLWSRDFPRVAIMQPFVCDFDLPSIFNDLIENAEFVSDTVSDGRNV